MVVTSETNVCANKMISAWSNVNFRSTTNGLQCVQNLFNSTCIISNGIEPSFAENSNEVLKCYGEKGRKRCMEAA